MLIFADDGLFGGFYAMPKLPRIKTANGVSTLQLLVLGQRSHGLFEATSGLFSCTTTLELTATEKHTIEEGLRSVLPKATASLVQLMPISWTHGSVSLRADSILALQGAPSLIAGNDCVFQAKLSRHEAKELETQWRRDGYSLHVSYKVGVLARGASDFLIEGLIQSGPHHAAQLVRCIESP